MYRSNLIVGSFPERSLLRYRVHSVHCFLLPNNVFSFHRPCHFLFSHHHRAFSRSVPPFFHLDARRGGEGARGHSRRGNPVASQGLERDLLGLVDAGALDRPEPLHELPLQRAVVGLGPRAVLFQGLGHAHLEVEASSTHLSRDLGVGELLEPGEELVEEGLARLEGLRVAGPSRRSGGVLAPPLPRHVLERHARLADLRSQSRRRRGPTTVDRGREGLGGGGDDGGG
mmetsp:Transcript_58466/g.124032  ORF Transcript_58466/g.124032 Transcript_58466/m.124032 type:complete len:228 (+) Transcript_58466:49-732(+)